MVLLVFGFLACGTASDGADTPSADVAVEWTYPEGPYGTAKDDIIDDLSFYEPVGEATVWLHQWYQDPKVRLLMIISTAGW